MPVYWLRLDEEDDVGEGRIVDYGSHVNDQVRDRLIVDFVLFKFTNIKDTNIIKPFTAIKSSKNEKLLRPNNTGRVSLSPCRRLLKF